MTQDQYNTWAVENQKQEQSYFDQAKRELPNASVFELLKRAQQIKGEKHARD
jgi:hypothetical protein